MTTPVILVDADACPGEIKELLYRAAERVHVKLTLVANQSLRIPRSEFIETLLVRDGANVADRRIVELAFDLLDLRDLVYFGDVKCAVTQGDTVRRIHTSRQCFDLALAGGTALIEGSHRFNATEETITGPAADVRSHGRRNE